MPTPAEALKAFVKAIQTAQTPALQVVANREQACLRWLELSEQIGIIEAGTINLTKMEELTTKLETITTALTAAK
jgi:hypothetical protein